MAALTKGRDELLGRNRDLELDVKQLEYRCRELQQEAAEGERKVGAECHQFMNHKLLLNSIAVVAVTQ